jgi:kumamolisin
MNAPGISGMSASEQLELVIGLLPRNSDALKNAVGRVSNPADSDYRQFLSPEQFADQFGATTDEYQRVVDWAKAHNLAIVTNQNRLVLKASGLVADIEAAMHLHLYYALRADGSRFHTPDVEPSFDIPLPIEHISNLENFDVPKRSVGSGLSGNYHAPDFRNAYASCTAMTGAGQSVGVVMLDDFSQSDVTAYFTSANLAPPLLVQKIPNDSSKGSTPNTEGNLDVQMVLSIAPQAQVVTFIGKDINSILTDMAAHPEIKQLSSSWFMQIDSTAKNLIKQFAMQGQIVPSSEWRQRGSQTQLFQ